MTTLACRHSYSCQILKPFFETTFRHLAQAGAPFPAGMWKSGAEALFLFKGLLDFMLESAFAMLLHHAPTQYPARAARQRRVSRQSSSPVDRAVSRSPVGPAQYPARAARQWIPQSIPPAARQWIPQSIPPERLASGSRQVSR